jgi:hypothetical protein
MVYSKKEREQYNIDRIRTCERLGIRELDYNAFRRIGQALNKIYCDSCNGDINDKQYEDLTMPLYLKANNLVHRLSLYIYFQTDPRGATIYLDKKVIPENNYTTACVIY